MAELVPRKQQPAQSGSRSCTGVTLSSLLSPRPDTWGRMVCRPGEDLPGLIRMAGGYSRPASLSGKAWVIPKAAGVQTTQGHLQP